MPSEIERFIRLATPFCCSAPRIVCSRCIPASTRKESNAPEIYSLPLYPDTAARQVLSPCLVLPEGVENIGERKYTAVKRE